MKKIATTALALAALVVASCSGEEEVKAAGKEGGSASKSTLKEDLAALGEAARAQAADFADAAGDVLHGLEGRMENLEDRLENAEGETREKIASTIENLEARRKELAKKLDELAAKSGEKAAEARTEIQKALEDLADEVESALERYR